MPRITADSIPAHRSRQHEALLASFHRLLGERGYGAVTLSDVAADAGMSRTTVYNYFTDKEAMLLAILERDVQALVERARTAVAEAPTATAALSVYIEHQIGEFSRNDVASHDLMGQLGPRGVAGIRQHLQPVSTLHREILERGMAAGEFRSVDLDETARLISNLIGAERLPVATGERDPALAAATVTDFVLTALAAAPPTTT
ncbi:MAG: TetR/AcrR family transcriptional regulator [Acidimicrobiales bacterium]